METKIFGVFLLHYIVFQGTNGDSPNPNNKDVSVLFVGMSGSGIFSTVQKLVNSDILKTDNSIPMVTEYSWKFPMNRNENESDITEATIKIASSPGLVLGKTSEQDAITLGTIKEYIQNPSGLNKGCPSIVIVVSKFDDTRAGGDNSNFVRMLRNVERLKDDLSPADLTSNIIFHFTHLMRRTRQEVRKPHSTMEMFKRIIREYTTFPDPITVTIGENLPEEYGLSRNGPYIQLPNKQLYPKNLIDEMTKILDARGDSYRKATVEAAFGDQFGNPQQIIVNKFSMGENSKEIENLATDITSAQFGISDPASEINLALRTAHDELDPNLKRNHNTVLQLVQLTFQRLNITSRENLPKTTVKTVELFQELPFNAASLSLVQNAFDLKQPEFIYPPIVGEGYDILKDETIPISPFVANKPKPSKMGYSFPDILLCDREDGNLVENFKLIQGYDEYMEKRLQDLDVQENINSSVFQGTVRPSYNNIRPDSDAFVAMTAVQEIRYFKLELNKSSDLNEEFLADANNLTPFNPSNRDSPNEWKAFFNKYGTHVVSEAYGGGIMEGKASGNSIYENLRHANVLYEIKDTLLSFKSLPQEVNSENIEIFHSFFGGSPDIQLGKAHNLPSENRKQLLQQWKDSVRLNPRISELTLKLVSIDKIVSLSNKTIGDEVEKSLSHYYNGTLKYVRRKTTRKPSTKSPSNIYSTTTAKAPRTTPATTATLHDPIFSQNSDGYPTTTDNTIPSGFLDPDAASCSCPETPTCGPCPPCLRQPSCPPFENEDNTENILGQSFHILKDTVLPNSPFSLCLGHQHDILVPNQFKVIKMNPCVTMTYEAVNSFNDYVAKRLNKHFVTQKPLTNTDSTQFTGIMKPGYNILPKKNTPQRFRMSQEMRYFKIEAKNNELLFLSPEFVHAVKNLESYQNNQNNCTILKDWYDFFNKYGTHVIIGAYAGITTDTVISGVSLEHISEIVSGGYIYDTCRIMKPYELRKDLKYCQVSLESALLDKLKYLVWGFENFLRTEYDTVIEDLVYGKLHKNLLRVCKANL